MLSFFCKFTLKFIHTYIHTYNKSGQYIHTLGDYRSRLIFDVLCNFKRIVQLQVLDVFNNRFEVVLLIVICSLTSSQVEHFSADKGNHIIYIGVDMYILLLYQLSPIKSHVCHEQG